MAHFAIFLLWISVAICGNVEITSAQSVSSDFSEINQLQFNNAKPILEQCERADIIFLLDSSSSVVGQFRRQLQLLVDLAKIMHIGPEAQRVALIQYSGSRRTVMFKFDDKRSNEAVIAALQQLEPYAQTTQTGEALLFAQQLLDERRPGVPSFMVVVTDGYSQDSVDVPAATLRQLGIQIYGVAFTSILDRDSLLKIAGVQDHVFVGNDSALLVKLLEQRLRCLPTPMPDASQDVAFIGQKLMQNLGANGFFDGVVRRDMAFAPVPLQGGGGGSGGAAAGYGAPPSPIPPTVPDQVYTNPPMTLPTSGAPPSPVPPTVPDQVYTNPPMTLPTNGPGPVPTAGPVQVPTGPPPTFGPVVPLPTGVPIPAIAGCRVDVLIIIDASGSETDVYKQELAEGVQILNRFQIDQDHAHIALVRFSGPNSAVVDYSFSDKQEKQILVQKMQSAPFIGGTTNLGDALDLGNKQLQPANGARDGVPRIAVVLSDGYSQQDVTSQAAALLKNTMGVYAVAAGQKFWSIPTLSLVAGDPGRVYTDITLNLFNQEVDRLTVNCA